MSRLNDYQPAIATPQWTDITQRPVMNYFRIYGQWYYTSSPYSLGDSLLLTMAIQHADLVVQYEHGTTDIAVLKPTKGPVTVPSQKEMMTIRLQSQPISLDESFVDRILLMNLMSKLSK